MENCQWEGRGLRRILAVVTLSLFVGVVEPAKAESCASDHLPGTMERPDGFPAGPLTLIVPYGAGGGSGQLARAKAQAFAEFIGVTIKIVYKSGGSGRKGLDAFLSTASDGNPSCSMWMMQQAPMRWTRSGPIRQSTLLRWQLSR